MRQIRLLAAEVSKGVTKWQDLQTGEVFQVNWRTWRKMKELRFPNGVRPYIGELDREGVIELDNFALGFLKTH